MSLVAIALGSNLGDRRAHLAWAIDELTARLDDVRVSSILETEPVGVPDEQPPYLNAAITGRTDLAPEALLDLLLSLERARGRERPSLLAPRTLDLDLIFYGDAVLMTEALEVPHPRFRERRFVLEPLSEIAGDWIDPVTGERVDELTAKVKPPQGA
jgi:2-amino-4-hydroxy-6-hydroxymethyldihydropteridine diphosphokinase